MDANAGPAARLHRRSADLAALFATIARTRMAGVPVLNPALRVETVGFECLPAHDDEAVAGLGILITPWFMNLVRLPLQRDDSAAQVGAKAKHRLGGQPFEFIGAHEPAIGAFAACSLFSPMFEFGDQATARATAWAVLAQLRNQPAPAAQAAVRVAVPVPLPAAAALPAEPGPARRSFLFGRSAARDSRP